MPPPHFSTSIGATSQHTHNQQQPLAPPSLSDLPKTVRSYAREALQSIHAALTTEDEVSSQSSSLKAFQAINKLVGSPDLQQQGENDSSARARVTSGEGLSTAASGSQNEGSSIPLGKQVAVLINTSLFNCFSDDMDQDSHSRRQLLISFLHALQPILDPRSVVMEWWDVLLRPMLKNPYCNVSVSRKAQSLVIWAMSETPSAAYVDEPNPTSSWPLVDQSSYVAAAKGGRKPGDAPYPASSTRSASQSRSSDDGDSRMSALFSTPARRAGPVDPLRRFTQRIFDLYTSEASSANTKSAEDEEIRDIEEHEEENDDELEEEPQNANDELVAGLDMVGPTWRGNLEAIILTFGDARPKPFFHHLSESFVEPQSRIPILLLLTIFFRISSLYAYHVVSTPFLRLLVLSLQLDTSKTSTSLAVLALVTLIPHFPNWLASGGAGGLPALLSIFARIVDWRRLGPGWEERSSALIGPDGKEDEDWAQVERISRRLQLRKGLEWKRLETSYDTAQSQRPNAEMLFTVLYGIFPCNVIRFLRAPIDYLRKTEYQSPFQVDWEDIIDEAAVQQRSAPILRRHVLHPALVDMDAEREITDTQRWKDHDTASTTADCASLYLGNGDLSTASSLSGLNEMYGRSVLARNFSGSSCHSDTPTDLGYHLSRSVNHSNESGGHENPTQAAPHRFYRQRSVSENLGRPSRSVLQAGMVQTTLTPQLTSRKRDTSVHFSPLQSRDSSTFTSPRLPSTWERQPHDDNLRAHVALRSGMSLSGTRSHSGGDAFARPGSSRSTSAAVVRSFYPAQSTLSSTVLSPSRSGGPTSGLAHSVSTGSAPPSPSIEANQAGRDRSGSLSSAAFPSGNGERTLLGSPALSFGGSPPMSKRTRFSYLKQENLQLRNELNYEIGQKDQLLRHIGTVHRNRVKDTVLEEELQNLYHMVRSQKIQLKSIKDELEVAKTEARQGKSRQANWQADLTAKLKTIREEKKAWGNEVRILKIHREDREELIAKLERQLDENAGELFELRERVKVDEKKVVAISEYEEKIRRLQTCLRFWDEDMLAFEGQRREMRRLLSRWEEMSMLVEASEAELVSATKRMTAMESEREGLEKRLFEANEAITALASKKMARVTTPLSASKPSPSLLPLAREDGEKSRMKKRIEELEALLLDARVHEEQWQMAKAHGGPVNQLNALPSEHEIAPFSLGEPVDGGEEEG